MADKRYKLLGTGLPGKSGFTIGDLERCDIVEWDGDKWVPDTRLKIFIQLAQPVDVESKEGDLWHVR